LHIISHNTFSIKVLNTFKRKYNGDLISIKALGVPEIKLTPNHNIIVSEYLAKCNQKIYKKGKAKMWSGDINKIPAGKLNKKYYLLFPKPVSKCNIPDYVNNIYIELAGYYISEGCVTKSNRSWCRVGFTFNTKEKKYIERITYLLGLLYPSSKINVSVKSSHNTATDIIIHKKELADRLVNDFGRISIEKKVPSWLLYGKKNQIKLFLKGVFNGDGCSEKKGYCLSTISEDFCYGIDFLLKRIGVISRTRISKQKRNNNHDLYQVMIHNFEEAVKISKIVDKPLNKKGNGGLERIFEKDGYFYHKIQKIEKIPYSGYVYNVEVNDVNTYVTKASAVMNSCHPRDAIALSFLARELDLSFDWFEIVMLARQKQTEWFADMIISEYHKHDGRLPVGILGKSYKPDIALKEGSPALLLKNILLEKRFKEFEIYDPFFEAMSLKNMFENASIFFVATRHEIFVDYRFAKGSVVFDPFGYIKDQDGVEVIRIGRMNE